MKGDKYSNGLFKGGEDVEKEISTVLNPNPGRDKVKDEIIAVLKKNNLTYREAVNTLRETEIVLGNITRV